MAKYRFLILCAAALLTFSTAPACRAKYGCPANESMQPKVNRKGELKNKRKSSSSQLFDKKMRKRMSK